MAKMELKRVGIFSSAKISGIVGAGLGLIIGVIYGLIMMTVGAAMLTQNSSGAGPGAGVGIIGGLIMMIVIPIFYGVLSFIFGALYAVIYNIAAGFVGGLEMEFENTQQEYATPPPPQWSADQYQPGQQQYPYS